MTRPVIRDVTRTLALTVVGCGLVAADVAVAPLIAVDTTTRFAGFVLASAGVFSLALWMIALALCPELWEHGRRRNSTQPDVTAARDAAVSAGFVVDRIPAEQLLQEPGR